MSKGSLRAGESVAGTWRIVRAVGVGAHGAVYEAEHRFLGRVAFKVLHAADADVDALVNEASILARILHPNVVRVFDAGVLEIDRQDVPYLATEFVEGGTIEDVLQARIRLEPREVLSVTDQMLAGLQAAHELTPPVLHRDLIPSNILVSAMDPWRVKLGDFAIAQRLSPELGLARVEGVIRYFPPEARLGYLDIRSDLYAAGLIAYQMLTGVFPFRSSSPDGSDAGYDAMLAARLSPPPLPSRFRPEILPGVDGLLMKALAPNPDDRFGSAREFRMAVLAMTETE